MFTFYSPGLLQPPPSLFPRIDFFLNPQLLFWTQVYPFSWVRFFLICPWFRRLKVFWWMFLKQIYTTNNSWSKIVCIYLVFSAFLLLSVGVIANNLRGKVWSFLCLFPMNSLISFLLVFFYTLLKELAHFYLIFKEYLNLLQYFQPFLKIMYFLLL